MYVECLRRARSASLGKLVATVLAVIPLLLTAGPAAAQTRALDCNSDLNLAVPAAPLMPGDTFQVTMTVVNGPSTDIVDNPVAQTFSSIEFNPSCTTTLPCVVDATLPVTFVGLVSNTCGVMPVATPMGGGTLIEFTFPPDPPALTLPAAASALGTTSCDIVFDAMVDAAVDPMTLPRMVAMEARTTGLCDVTQLNSSAEGTAEVDVNAPPPACGDGNVDPGETCDPADPMAPAGCRPVGDPEECTYCGDGNQEMSEQCDDGNNVDGDGCDATCNVEPACGDGNVDPGETCDPADPMAPAGCRPVGDPEECTYCGDGNQEMSEQCDDGNNVDGDGCDATCNVEPFCGDGNLDPGEQCDDGNNVDGDGCSATCMTEVPTVGEWGLIGLALLLGLAAWISLRRRAIEAP